jgi:hypothetical protein
VLKQSLAFKFGRKFSETETEWDFEKITKTRNHNKRIDNGVRHNIAYVSEPLPLWGRLLYFYSKDQKYISAMPIGYNTNLVMFFQISRTQQRKRHVKHMFGAPRNGLQASAPQ